MEADGKVFAGDESAVGEQNTGGGKGGTKAEIEAGAEGLRSEDDRSDEVRGDWMIEQEVWLGWPVGLLAVWDG